MGDKMTRTIVIICAYFTILFVLAGCSNQPSAWTLRLLDSSSKYTEVDFDEFTNSVWLSTFQDSSMGIYDFDNAEFSVENLPDEYQQLTTCIADSVWVVTTDKTLLKQDKQTNSWEVVLLENFILKTCRTLPNGDVVLYSDTRIFFPETFSEVVIPASVGSILDFTKDRNQTLWVLTTEGGVWGYSDQSWTKYGDVTNVDAMCLCGEDDLCIFGDNSLYRWKKSSGAFSLEKLLVEQSLSIYDSIVFLPDNRLFWETTTNLWSIDESGLKKINLPIGVNRIWSIDTDTRSNLFVLTNLGLFYLETTMVP